MVFVKMLSQLSKKDVVIAGGKGASLGELVRVGLPIPPGFVILSSAFDRFLTETDPGEEIAAILKQVKFKNINSVDGAAVKIRKLILTAEFSKSLGKEILSEFIKLRAPLVAVRSSATAEDSSSASWAGELESYLCTDKKHLLENIKNCWASLYTPRAIFYRLEKKLNATKISVAVVVQKMVQSEVSGITFTVHPVTKDRDQLVIEAGWGLGEAIVGGKIIPDSYVISKKRGEIIEKNVSEQKMMIVKGLKGTVKKAVQKTKQDKQKLTDRRIIELARLCAKIERHYGEPQDIEWALAKRKFYILQSRPITTLK